MAGLFNAHSILIKTTLWKILEQNVTKLLEVSQQIVSMTLEKSTRAICFINSQIPAIITS